MYLHFGSDQVEVAKGMERLHIPTASGKRRVYGPRVKRLVILHIPYFFDQTPRLLFISLLVLCGYYSRAATIRGRRLFF